MRLGRVEVGRGFLMLWAWLLYQAPFGIVSQTLLACLFHEAGHCLALYHLQQHIRKIVLTPFGAEISFQNTLTYPGEFLVAAAGPASNLLLAYFFCTFSWGKSFAGINLSLALFNLLPVGRLDGARCLRSIFFSFFPCTGANRISEVFTLCFTAVFLGFALFWGILCRNLTLLLMCLWMVNGLVKEKSF